MSVSTLSNQTVTIENPTGNRDKHGQSAFSAPATATVRFERTYKTIKTAEREREPIDAIMGCDPGISISKGARVTYQTEVFRAMQIAEAIDGAGNVHHREVMLQLWSFSA